MEKNKRVEMFIRRQATDRWPTADSEQKYFELNNDKKAKGGRKANGIKPPAFPFALLEQAIGHDDPIRARTINKLLICSSLKIKKVRRYPGWVLQRTYNLKNRVLDFS